MTFCSRRVPALLFSVAFHAVFSSRREWGKNVHRCCSAEQVKVVSSLSSVRIPAERGERCCHDLIAMIFRCILSEEMHAATTGSHFSIEGTV